MQKRAIEMYRGPITDAFLPTDSLSYNNKRYVFNGGSFDLINDTCGGEWIEIDAVYTGFSIADRDRVPDQGSEGDSASIWRNQEKWRNEWTQYKELTQTSAVTTATGTLTSISIDAPGHTRIKDGDTLYLVDPRTGINIHTVTVNGDVGSSDTSITVDSTALGDDVPQGAYIVHKPAEVVQAEIVRMGEKVVQTQIRQTKEFIKESPNDAEDITIWYTPVPITITEIDAVLTGSSTPSVTWTIRHNSDRSATGNEVVTSGTTTTTTTTAQATTVFNDETVPAGSWIWLETTALSGTVDSLGITIQYTED